MSKELIADCLNWLRRRTADQYERDAADIIEKQQKRIEELEAELMGERCLSFRNQVEKQQKRIELYEQALKASWPEGAMGDAFDYWNAARREDV